jgi:gliding motility associated protien GldN
MKQIALGLIVLFSFLAISEVSSQAFYGDFTYDKKTIKERKIIPYPPLREADVMKSNRIHRIVDSREKMNVVMNWPRNPFSKIIYESVTTGYGRPPIPIYKNDSLLEPKTPEEVVDMFSYENVTQYAPYEDDPDYMIDTVIRENLIPDEVIFKYEIMEDWVFDKQRSMYFPRIIAIAPMFKMVIDGKEMDKEVRLGWVKWEDLKQILITQEIFNRHNDAMRITYWDFFELRMFTSYINKEMNAFDNYIYEFEEFENDPLASLLEAEKIKHKLFDWEHDLWEW